MNYTIVLTEQAKSDLVEIYKYIAIELQSPKNAAGQLSRIEKAIASLDQMPERYCVHNPENWKNRNLRFMPIDNYLVFYLVSGADNTVSIVRIMYGGRAIDKQLETLQ